MVRSTAGCTIGPLKAFCECIIPDTERRKRLISINGFSSQEMLILVFIKSNLVKILSLLATKNNTKIKNVPITVNLTITITATATATNTSNFPD